MNADRINNLKSGGFVRMLNWCVKEFDKDREKLLEILEGEEINVDFTNDIEETALRFLQELKKEIDFDNLMEGIALNLGLKNWSDEPEFIINGKEIKLLPPYLCALLPENIDVYGLYGKKVDFNFLDCDLETRFGATAYGILVGKE